MKDIFEIKRRNKVQYCDCCGKKIEAKASRVIIHMPLGLKSRILCYGCANGVLIDFFMREK